MENKYFTPKIEDLFVGYECETILLGEYDTHFDLFLPEGATQEEYDKAWAHCQYNTDKVKSEKHTLTKEDLINFLQFDGNLRSGKGIPVLGFLRTLCLTKQDLRQEGWAVGFPPAVHGQTVQSSPSYKFYIEKGNYMGLILNDGRLEILLKDVLLDSRTENSSNGRLYLGECPSINEFRIITNKLLNIK